MRDGVTIFKASCFFFFSWCLTNSVCKRVAGLGEVFSNALKWYYVSIDKKEAREFMNLLHSLTPEKLHSLLPSSIIYVPLKIILLLALIAAFGSHLISVSLHYLK